MDIHNETPTEDAQRMTREFVFKKSHIIGYKIAFSVLLGLILLSLVLPLWFVDAEGRLSAYVIVLIFSGEVSIILVMLYISLRQSKCSNITTDEDGIWYTHIGKTEGLVLWSSIFRFRHAPGFTDVFDGEGQKLIRVVDNLKERRVLIRWLVEKTDENIAAREAADTRTTREFFVEKNVMRKTWLLFLGLSFVYVPGGIFVVYNEMHDANFQDWDVIAISLILIVILFRYMYILSPIVFLTIHFGRKSLRLPRAAITLEEEGLRYTHKPRGSALVPWHRIHKMKERKFQQCLDIMDINGCAVIRAEYELKDFFILRNRLLEKVEHNYNETLLDCFSKGTAHHLIYVVILAVILAPGFYLSKIFPEGALSFYVFSAVAFLILAGMYSYIFYRILVVGNTLVLISPVRKKRIAFADIKKVEMSDQYEQSIRGSEVVITTHDDAVYSLSTYARVDNHVLYVALKKAWAAHQISTDE